jgi:hypothetical protein
VTPPLGRPCPCFSLSLLFLSILGSPTVIFASARSRQALIDEVWVITFGVTNTICIVLKDCNACSVFALFAHALINELINEL